MKLNDAQRRAVCYGDGPCLILAGPGSGKTSTIVSRVQYLIENRKIPPQEILVITFTRFAAAQMKSRLCRALNVRTLPLHVGTFHGTYYGILKGTYRMSGENILSETEKYRLLKDCIRSLNIETYDEEGFIQDISAQISKVKNNRLDAAAYVPYSCAADDFRALYKEYESRKNTLRKIDFDDMLVLCLRLFLTRPAVLAQWQRRYKYILVDEFQDINRVQYDILRMLALPENNLFAVGDDDQAIYAFRGADSHLMLGFSDDYPDAGRILLNINYRSAPAIVENSLKVIQKNTVRFDKKLKAVRRSRACVHVQETKDARAEARYVAEEIQALAAQGINHEDMAVLCRVHTDVQECARSLAARGIPFSMKEKMPNIYRHFIAQDIGAYFRLALGSRKRSDFLRVMNRPVRYISRESLSGILPENTGPAKNSAGSADNRTNSAKVSFDSRMRAASVRTADNRMNSAEVSPGPGMQAASARAADNRTNSAEVSFDVIREYYSDKDWMLDRVDQFEWDIRMLKNMAPFAAIRYIRRHIGYEEYLQEYAKTRNGDTGEWAEILNTLEASARDILSYEDWFAMTERYTRVLEEKNRQAKEEMHGVNLMTIHAAKGLEFDTVFLVHANEGRIPYKRARSDEAIEEERRLFYVAMTRAANTLKISYVKELNEKKAKASVFVRELLS